MDKQCDLLLSKVEEGTEILLKILKEKKSDEKSLLSGPKAIRLKIEFIKIPIVKRKVLRIPLPHSTLTKTADVCLFVPDLVRGRNVDHAATIKHYKKLLAKKGLDCVNTVMPSRQVRVEYSQYEALRRLSSSFDVFLIDDKIHKFLTPKLGKSFRKMNKCPIPVHLKEPDLKKEIESKLKKSCMFIDESGPNRAVKVGHEEMCAKEIAENVRAAVQFICSYFPRGGWINIRSLELIAHEVDGIPLYFSFASGNDVLDTPRERDTSCKKVQPITEQVSIIGKKVTVYPDGNVLVHSSKGNNKGEWKGKEGDEEEIENSFDGENEEENSDEGDGMEDKYLRHVQTQKDAEPDSDQEKSAKVEGSIKSAAKISKRVKKGKNSNVPTKKKAKLMKK